MTEIVQEDGRWAKVPAAQHSEIYKGILSGEHDATPKDPDADCLICRAPAESLTVFHSWRDNGEESVGMMHVCLAHRGEWWWHPRNALVLFDGETQRCN